jgi:hypothetical protein
VSKSRSAHPPERAGACKRAARTDVERVARANPILQPMATLAPPPPLPALTRRGRRFSRGLAAALAISLAVHLAFTLWPASLPDDPDDVPLTATLRELPPPPPVVAPAPPPPAKSAARRATAPRHVEARVDEPPATEPAASPAAAPATPAPSPTARAAAAEAPLAEAADVPPAAPPSGKALPPRVDLAYKIYLGHHDFLIGDATYRFEHSGSRYRIYTVGRAKGLAALLVRGEGRLESRGIITDEGLQPVEFTFERSDTGKHEAARFDWEAGIVTLAGDKSAPIDTPMFDALSLMWQYYFTPPDARRVAFSLATTRRVTRYTVTHEGDEALRWGEGTIATERWHRVSDDGNGDSYVWLAPSLRYLPVKMRLANKRGTVDILLDAIRVDPSAGAGDGGWAPSIGNGTAVMAPQPGTAPPPTEFAPGATFPTNTGG